MPDKFVDLVFTSPPYNMNLRIRNGEYCSRQIIKDEFSTKYNDFPDNMPIKDFYKLHKSILLELIRVSHVVFYNIQIVTGSKRAFFNIIGDLSDNLKDIIVWDKCHGQPAMAGGVLNRRTELILVFEDSKRAISRQFKKRNFNRGTLEDIWCIKKGPKISKDNSAVFPELLAEKVILNFSNEGDLIYDPFTGTGTTLKVAKKLKRNYVGSELSSQLCDSANLRINEA